MDDWRVLLVDDDPHCRSALGALMRGRGFEVDEAAHGRQALDRLFAHPVSLVITDLMMPVMDGWALLRAMKDCATLANIPVIVLSASPCGDAAADGYMMKPIRVLELLDMVECLRADASGREAQGTYEGSSPPVRDDVGLRD